MRLALCIKKDLIGNTVLNHILPAMPEAHCQVFLCDRVDPAERAASQETDFVFYERDLPLDHLFPSLDRAPTGVHRAGRQYSFEQLAQRHGIAIDSWGNINEEPAFGALAEFGPDFIVTARYNYILQQPAIDLARRAVVNIHPGLLPRYAGVYPSFRALQQRDETFGASLHYIRDPQIDHGPLLSQADAAVAPEHSVLWHIRTAYLMGANLLLEFLQQVAGSDELPAGMPQQQDQRRYFGYPSQAEFQQLRARGIPLIRHGEYLEWLTAYAAPE